MADPWYEDLFMLNVSGNFIFNVGNTISVLLDEIENLEASKDILIRAAKLGQCCWTCAYYRKNCAPLNPSTGCTVWKWNENEKELEERLKDAEKF